LLRTSVVVTMLPSPYKAKGHSSSGVAEPRHKPELDGIRGIALLAVMLSHGGPYIERTSVLSKLFAYAMIPGWSGVELFFVLSGFLITGILLKSKTAENYFSSFYARRFLRIFPIYYLVLTAGLLAASHVSWWNAVLPAAGKTRIAYYFYAQNWPMFWPHHLFLRANVFGHFWSLAVEEQFYIVWPLVIWLLPENAILTLCSVGLVVALPLRVLMVHKFAYDFTAMALTTSRVDGLLVGVILAILLRRGQIPLRWIFLCMGAGAGPYGVDWNVFLYADDRDHGVFVAVGRIAGAVTASHRLAASHSGRKMAGNGREIQLWNVHLSHSGVRDLRPLSGDAFWSGVADAAGLGVALCRIPDRDDVSGGED